MTTNQTIDGVLVSRELLELAYLELVDTFSWAGELRALLDGPVCKLCNDTGKMHEPGQDPGSCSACLERPAAQPQVEPVAWRYRDGEGTQWRLTDMPPQTWYFDPRQYEIRKLYERPAPVAVVLPERRDFDPLDFVEKRASADGWNACLDELKRINPSL